MNAEHLVSGADLLCAICASHVYTNHLQYNWMKYRVDSKQSHMSIMCYLRCAINTYTNLINLCNTYMQHVNVPQTNWKVPTTHKTVNIGYVRVCHNTVCVRHQLLAVSRFPLSEIFFQPEIMIFVCLYVFFCNIYMYIY